MVERLAGIMHEILETSKLNVTIEPLKTVDMAELLAAILKESARALSKCVVVGRTT